MRVGELLLGIRLGVPAGLLRLREGVSGPQLGGGRPPLRLGHELAVRLLRVGQPLVLKPLGLGPPLGELVFEIGLRLGAQRLGLLEQELLPAADLVRLALGGPDDVVALALGGGPDLHRVPLGLGADAGLLELGRGS